MKKEIDKYIRDHREELIDLTIELSKIPSFSGNEDRKAGFVLDYLQRECNIAGRKDSVGNVICRYDGTDSDGSIVFCAHIDTVFEGLEEIAVQRRGNLIYAPSIYDNSVNAAALLFAVKMLQELKINLAAETVFVFSVGEEGLGNLLGVRHFVDEYPGTIKEFIAVDLGWETVSTVAVGSLRYQIDIKAPGGHGWKDFGNMNAIAVAADIIRDIYRLKVPEKPRTTFNVGKISGGTSVNSIAEECRFYVSFRSEAVSQLELLVAALDNLLEERRSDEVKIGKSLIGNRPAASGTPQAPLVQRIIKLREKLGIKTVFTSNSTDANYPMSRGIPSVTIGVCNGGDPHTLNEYLDPDSLDTGLRMFLYLVTGSIN